jgi:trans-aconitate methyltransferase
MTIWNPNQYLKFSEKRLRPAIDLASKIVVDVPSKVIDLVCGSIITSGVTGITYLFKIYDHSKIGWIDYHE